MYEQFKGSQLIDKIMSEQHVDYIHNKAWYRHSFEVLFDSNKEAKF